MKRGLVLNKYGTQAASTRQRFVQAAPYLATAGIAIEIEPLFDNDYLAPLMRTGKRPLLPMLYAYARRFRAVLRAKNYDFIWVHCECFPYLPGAFESLIGWSGKPIIYDFDDAIFHQYDQHPLKMVRTLLGRKLAPLLRRADIAFCGNAYLRDYAAQFCPHTEIMPTTVDVTTYVPRATATQNQPPVLGWIGSPSTWNYCVPLTEVLSAAVTNNEIMVQVVGANHAANAALPFTFKPWNEASEIADIQAMDIGMMPIPDEPWARGKCGYKLIQYMACGVPVIASPVGINCEIVEHGVNGFLASTPAEWAEAIRTLAGDAALRQRMGGAGRKRVMEHYSIQTHGPRMAALIHQLV